MKIVDRMNLLNEWLDTEYSDSAFQDADSDFEETDVDVNPFEASIETTVKVSPAPEDSVISSGNEHIMDINKIRISSDRIESLTENEIFVFGSNLAGKHIGGAARQAYQKFGAEWGIGNGPTGQSYAIPTMQGGIETVAPYIEQFTQYAQAHSEMKFLVTKIGCGVAKFHPKDIAPYFSLAAKLPNVFLPAEFWLYLQQ